jgi:hypothetical protein
VRDYIRALVPVPSGPGEGCQHRNRWTTKDDVLECMDCHAVLGGTGSATGGGT